MDLIMNHAIRPKTCTERVNRVGLDFLLTLNMRGQRRTHLQLLYKIPSMSLGCGRDSCVTGTAGIRDRTQLGPDS